MNVLMITEKDAANASLGKIAEFFLKHGDEVIIFASYYDEQVLRCFPKSISRYPINEINEEVISACSIIFCSTLASIYLPSLVFEAHKPIFTHNYLMNRQVNWGGDLCFAPSQRTVASDYDEFLNYSYMGIGEPKYDEVVKETNGKHNRMLFIDSGHYPFSYNGKKELARIILHICKKYPDYELWIKPRFLPGDKVITHRNNIHLYDVLHKECEGIFPDNLVMLTTHQDLKELINQTDTVICMYSTAFVGAVVAGKGLIVIDNLPTQDVYDIRHKTYMRTRENMVASGALIDYHDIDAILPNGVKSTEEYLDFLLDERVCAAEKIVEVCYDLWITYYSKGLFPKLHDTTYRRYKSEFSVDNDMTWEKQITKRCHDYILLKSLILIDFHVKSKLDISYILKRADECVSDDGIIHEDIFRVFLADVNEYRDKCIIHNETTMLEDDIDAGILLNAYYLQKEYDKIRSFQNKRISAFHLYRAFTALETQESNAKEIAKNQLILYFEKCMGRKYNLEISDMPNNRFRAYMELLDLLKEDNDYVHAEYYVKSMREFYKSNYFINSTDEIIEEFVQKERFEYIIKMEMWIDEKK